MTLLFAAAGCTEDDKAEPKAAAPKVSTTAPAGKASDPPSTLTPEQKAAIAENAGLPPDPDKATWARYITELKAIDPDIVHAKEEKAVSRGKSQCQSVKSWPTDRSKLIGLVEQRFSSPNHPSGFGPTKSAAILDAVRKHICPTY
ncbi:hypothetical protein [Streptomyces sp. SID3343]|uniref:hypothetical protein n=1 Tax=Streptomyces sp. SID3343 TaxID=2690260 RepID=UPI00136AC4FC|nr:hypothetical protein [Streptomyces sp. SID3343]MYW03475.1 hypothetical protein [Streptomyces sp. SID3343]